MLYAHRSEELDITGLEAQHFFDHTLRTIWESLRALDVEGKPFDMVSVAAYLQGQGKLQALGGTPKLAEIGMRSAALGTPVIKSHASQILALWKARTFIATCAAAQSAITTADPATYDTIIREHDEVVSDIIISNRSDAPVRFFDAVKSSLSQIMGGEGAVAAVKTGFPSVDAAMGGGYHAGDVVVIAGRPGMGKTSLLLNTLVSVSSRGQRDATALFSLEMPLLQVATRILCTEAKIPMAAVRAGKLTAEMLSGLTGAASTLAEIPLWIDDKPGITVAEIRAKIRAVKRDMRRVYGDGKRLTVVGIDYLQLVVGTHANNREQEVAGVCRALKTLAKEEDVCILLLSQLNRETERSNNKRPTLKDLRESGAIEQDSDIVVFLYRPHYYDDSEDPALGEFIIAKQRNGETRTIQLRWDGVRMRYGDADTTHDFVDDLGDIGEDWVP